MLDQEAGAAKLGRPRAIEVNRMRLGSADLFINTLL